MMSIKTVAPAGLGCRTLSARARGAAPFARGAAAPVRKVVVRFRESNDGPVDVQEQARQTTTDSKLSQQQRDEVSSASSMFSLTINSHELHCRQCTLVYLL